MKRFLLITVLVMLFTGCSPNIVGKWNVDRYEIDNYNGQDFTASNAGEIIIKKNGTGEKNLSLNMFNRDPEIIESFRWDLSNQILRFYDNTSRQGSDFAKSWIVVTNKKNKQIWKSTDGSNSIQMMELSKN